MGAKTVRRQREQFLGNFAARMRRCSRVASAVTAASATRVEQWGVFEAAFNGPSTGNPFTKVLLSAQFTNGTLLELSIAATNSLTLWRMWRARC